MNNDALSKKSWWRKMKSNKSWISVNVHAIKRYRKQTTAGNVIQRHVTSIKQCSHDTWSELFSAKINCDAS
jgi:hypothetical protein